MVGRKRNKCIKTHRDPSSKHIPTASYRLIWSKCVPYAPCFTISDGSCSAEFPSSRRPATISDEAERTQKRYSIHREGAAGMCPLLFHGSQQSFRQLLRKDDASGNLSLADGAQCRSALPVTTGQTVQSPINPSPISQSEANNSTPGKPSKRIATVWAAWTISLRRSMEPASPSITKSSTGKYLHDSDRTRPLHESDAVSFPLPPLQSCKAYGFRRRERFKLRRSKRWRCFG